MYLKSRRIAMATFLAPQHRGESMTDSFGMSMSSTLQSPNVENNEIFRHMNFNPPQLLDSPRETRRHTTFRHASRGLAARADDREARGASPEAASDRSRPRPDR